jgi:hypothetical protein
VKKKSGAMKRAIGPHPHKGVEGCNNLAAGAGGEDLTLRLDIDDMMRWGGIRPGVHLAGGMGFNFYDDQLEIKFESHVGDPWDGSSRQSSFLVRCCLTASQRGNAPAFFLPMTAGRAPRWKNEVSMRPRSGQLAVSSAGFLFLGCLRSEAR